MTVFFTLTTIVFVAPADSGSAGKHKTCKKYSAGIERRKVIGWQFFGEVTFPTGHIFESTEVGGYRESPMILKRNATRGTTNIGP
jgi:hypothetical protein